MLGEGAERTFNFVSFLGPGLFVLGVCGSWLVSLGRPSLSVAGWLVRGLSPVFHCSGLAAQSALVFWFYPLLFFSLRVCEVWIVSSLGGTSSSSPYLGGVCV